jgi:hypothetical protein
MLNRRSHRLPEAAAAVPVVGDIGWKASCWP